MKNTVLLIAAFIISFNLSTAQHVVDQSNIGSGSARSLVDNIQACIQTFTAGLSGQLSQVQVDIETENCPYPLTCRILDGGPSGIVLASETVSIPVYTARSLYTIVFSTPAALTSGNVYAISLEANCISGMGLSTWWYKSTANAYANGQAFNQWGTTIQPEDSLNDFYFQTFTPAVSGVQVLEKENPSVFPNPVVHTLTVETSENAVLHVVDAQGRILAVFENENTTTGIDVSGLPGGVYFVIAKTRNGIATNRFIKL